MTWHCVFGRARAADGKHIARAAGVATCDMRDGRYRCCRCDRAGANGASAGGTALNPGIVPSAPQARISLALAAVKKTAGAVVVVLLGVACKSTSDDVVPDFQVCSDPAATDAYVDALVVPPVAAGTDLGNGRTQYTLTAQQGTHSFKSCASAAASTYGYDGDYLGPTLRIRRGSSVEVRVVNGIDQSTSVHWHGLATPSNVDITGSRLPPGATAVAQFTPDQPAATLWYHPHDHMVTGGQVFRGLAGVLLIDDDVAATLPHTYGVDDIPLVVQDRRFSKSGALDYMTYAEDTEGMLGNRIVVNGQIRPFKSVPAGPVRLRLLNLSNARSYAFALSSGQKFMQIASDGGLLAAPVEQSVLLLAAAERAEIVVDFTKVAGAVRLVSMPFKAAIDVESTEAQSLRPRSLHPLDADEGSSKPENDPARRPDNGTAFEIVELRVDPGISVPAGVSVPPTLASVPEPDVASAVNHDSPRLFGLEDTGDDVINGVKLDPTLERIDQHVRQGTSEVWSVKNDATDLAHPFHVHGRQFRILSRSLGPVDAGERGFKDTVLVNPTEEVRLLVSFDLEPGKYFFHCHILEHEDMGMMGIYGVDPK